MSSTHCEWIIRETHILFDFWASHWTFSYFRRSVGFSAEKVNSNCITFCYTWLADITRSKKGHLFFWPTKSFDTVPHRTLMCKLAFTSCTVNLATQLSLWKKTSVILNGETSDPVQVISRVPQGSVLGPLLFLTCIDDITSIQLSEGTNSLSMPTTCSYTRQYLRIMSMRNCKKTLTKSISGQEISNSTHPLQQEKSGLVIGAWFITDTQQKKYADHFSFNKHFKCSST